MDEEKIKSFAGKIFQDVSSSMGSTLAYIGVKTGLFRQLQGKGPLSLAQVIAGSELQSRYVEEWLKGMVCTGYLDYDAEAQTYELPDEHAYLLASEGTDHFMGGLLYSVPMMTGVAPKVAEAFVHGGGVRFQEFGEEGVEAIALMNEGTYVQRFASYWMKSVPTLHEALESGCQMLDFGCGTGCVAVTLGKAFPQSCFHGIDLDEASVAQARQLAKEQGLEERVQFLHGDLNQLAGQQFDLITICDCIHDLADPLGTLALLRSLLSETGSLFIVEPKASDHLEENINPIGGMYYGMSVLHCMTQSLASGGPGLGTCMGPSRIKALFLEAGYSSVEQLKIKSVTSHFYHVHK